MKCESIKSFRKYVTKEILPATKELESLPDNSRKHLQKLAYTNLVNRFDSMVDHVLLENMREDALVQIAIGGMNKPVTESDLISLLLKGSHLQDALDNKLTTALQNSVLRERHSKKVATMFDVFCAGVNVRNAPRVNISTGKIVDKIKPSSKTTPYSICGFCDWLYSRRNAIVHGAGRASYLKNDIAQLKKHYKCTPANTVIIKLGSVSTASTFYLDLVDIVEHGVAS